MKGFFKVLLSLALVTCVFAGTALGANQWRLKAGMGISGTPAFPYLRAVAVVDTDRAWVVGDAAGNRSTVWLYREVSMPTRILRTNTGKNVNFYCVAALDSTTCWVGGDRGTVIKTTNKGTTWATQTFPDSFRVIAISLKKGSSTVLNAVGQTYRGTVGFFKTANGGTTWTFVTVSGISSKLVSTITWTDSGAANMVSRRLWAGGGPPGWIYQSIDGGTNWFPGILNSGAGYITQAFSIDSTHTYFSGSRGTFSIVTTASDTGDGIYISPDSTFFIDGGKNRTLATWSGSILRTFTPAAQRFVKRVNKDTVTFYDNTSDSALVSDQADIGTDTTVLHVHSHATAGYDSGAVHLWWAAEDSVRRILKASGDTLWVGFCGHADDITSLRWFMPIPDTGKIAGLALATEYLLYTNPTLTSKAPGYIGTNFGSCATIPHDLTKIWLLGYPGSILYSANTGTTWSIVNTGLGSLELSKIAIWDATHIWAVGANGSIIKYGGR